jgi:hypothetical protein
VPANSGSAANHLLPAGPPHLIFQVWGSCKDNFLDHWIGHDRPISWPLHLLNVTPLDFSFNGEHMPPICLTFQCYESASVIVTLILDMSDKVWTEIEYRLDILHATSRTCWSLPNYTDFYADKLFSWVCKLYSYSCYSFLTLTIWSEGSLIGTFCIFQYFVNVYLNFCSLK